MQFTCHGQPHKLSAGEMLFLASREPHTVFAVEDSTVLLTMLMGRDVGIQTATVENWRQSLLAELCDHIEQTHHAYLKKTLPALSSLIAMLGGISIAMAQDVADNTTIPQPPKDRECPESQLTRLLQAHEITLQAARSMARQAIEVGDDGTNDMLVSDVIRGNELQVWFVSQHLVGANAHIE